MVDCGGEGTDFVARLRPLAANFSPNLPILRQLSNQRTTTNKKKKSKTSTASRTGVSLREDSVESGQESDPGGGGGGNTGHRRPPTNADATRFSAREKSAIRNSEYERWLTWTSCSVEPLLRNLRPGT
jgi:hypothetical protein